MMHELYNLDLVCKLLYFLLRTHWAWVVWPLAKADTPNVLLHLWNQPHLKSKGSMEEKGRSISIINLLQGLTVAPLGLVLLKSIMLTQNSCVTAYPETL